jgi:hypothetical protein
LHRAGGVPGRLGRGSGDIALQSTGNRERYVQQWCS